MANSVHQRSRPPLWLVAGFFLSSFIALAVVTRRIVALAHPASASPSPMGNLDAAFASHTALTLAHIIPAAFTVVAALFVLLLHREGRFWRWMLFIAGAVTGVTAYAMSGYAIGGAVEQAAVFVFDTWFLVSLGRAFSFFLNGDAAREHVWSLRAIGILFGIATTRPVMGVFFATRSYTHLAPDQFFGVAFWIGFAINAVAVETWLRFRSRRAGPSTTVHSVPGSLRSGAS